MVEAKGFTAGSWKCGPIAPRLLEQDKGAIDVGIDEFCCRVDRTVDMGFGGKMQNGVRLDIIE